MGCEYLDGKYASFELIARIETVRCNPEAANRLIQVQSGPIQGMNACRVETPLRIQTKSEKREREDAPLENNSHSRHRVRRCFGARGAGASAGTKPGASAPAAGANHQDGSKPGEPVRDRARQEQADRDGHETGRF